MYFYHTTWANLEPFLYRDREGLKRTDGAERNRGKREKWESDSIGFKDAAAKPFIVQRWIHPPNPVTMRQWLHTFQEAVPLNITRFKKPKSLVKWAGNSLYENFLRINADCLSHVQFCWKICCLLCGVKPLFYTVYTRRIHFWYRHIQREKQLLFSWTVLCWTPALHLGVNNLSKYQKKVKDARSSYFVLPLFWGPL